MKAQETRSKLRIEGRWQQNRSHLGKISFLKFADNYEHFRYAGFRYPKNSGGGQGFVIGAWGQVRVSGGGGR
jgi:hypothetical protein